MKIEISHMKDAEHATDALVLPLCKEEGIGLYRDIDFLLKGLLHRVITSGEFEGKKNQLTVLHTVGRMRPKRAVLIGLGSRPDVRSEHLRQAGGTAAAFINKLGCRTMALSTTYLHSLRQSPVPFVEGALLSLYSFDGYKKEKSTLKGLKRLSVITGSNASLRKSLKWVEAVAAGVHFARNLVNTPSNDMTPTALARTAESLVQSRVSVTVFDRKAAEKKGMGAYLSVAKGSEEPPRFIVIRYDGGKGAPIALVGKSITFDSGGISLKPSEGMEKMKYDMAGGAAVLAVIKVASEMRLPLNIVGVLPATENLPSGTAYKPGDIVRSITGKTIEIISTDAEGRLALADAIGYVKKLMPKAIIDIATLTGACPVALGNEAIAMMGNEDEILKSVVRAGNEVYERVWQMPLFEEYLEYIKGDFADLKNSGGKTGSLVTSGYFLKEFVGDTPWVHLDIAGTAWAEKERPYVPKGATGIGVRLLLEYLREMK